jgi:Icc-related predicted phosphoesterase
LHLEWYPDYGKAFVDSLHVEPDEVAVLAGDITLAAQLSQTLDHFAGRFRHVVFVAGNHEHYGTDRVAVARALCDAEYNNGNVTALWNHVLEFDGVRILGCPLWFPKPPFGAPTWEMNDYRLIGDFESWVYEDNRQSVEFLRSTMRPGDVVVTHYLPSYRSVHPKYAGSPLNAFFVCDMDALIAERQPALWVHGHTHESMDYRIGETRMVCNPYGYWRHEENQAWQARLIVEVGE